MATFGRWDEASRILYIGACALEPRLPAAAWLRGVVPVPRAQTMATQQVQSLLNSQSAPRQTMPIPGYGSGLAMPRSNSIVRVLIPMNDQGGALDFGLASADVEGIFNNYIPFRWVLEAPAPACRRLVGHYPQPGRGHPWAGSLNPGLLGHRPWGYSCRRWAPWWDIPRRPPLGAMPICPSHI